MWVVTSVEPGKAVKVERHVPSSLNRLAALNAQISKVKFKLKYPDDPSAKPGDIIDFVIDIGSAEQRGQSRTVYHSKCISRWPGLKKQWLQFSVTF
jgi:hypothetical protein